MNCGVEGKWPLSLLVHPEQLPAGLLCNLCTRIILFSHPGLISYHSFQPPRVVIILFFFTT